MGTQENHVKFMTDAIIEAVKAQDLTIEHLSVRVTALEAIEQRALDALRGNASETDEYERGWLDACAEILGKRP